MNEMVKASCHQIISEDDMKIMEDKKIWLQTQFQTEEDEEKTKEAMNSVLMYQEQFFETNKSIEDSKIRLSAVKYALIAENKVLTKEMRIFEKLLL